MPTGQKFDAQQHLSILDLAVDNSVNPNVLQLYLKHSKTDHFDKGTCVCIGCTGDDLCPVAAFMAYLAVRGMKQGPLFQTKDGLPVARESVVNNVRQVLQALGLESSHYVGHSFELQQQLQQQSRVFLIQQLKYWADGRVKHFRLTFVCLGNG